MKHRIFLFLLIGALFLAACQPQAAGTPTEGVASPAPSETPPPTEAAPTPTPTHIAVDLSPAERAAIQALSDKYGIPVEQIRLLKTEAVTWPSGCLGVVLPGVMCTQAQVEGFKIELEADGRQFEFHTNQDGTSVIDAAQQLATLRFAVRTSDRRLVLAEPNMGLGPTYNPAFNGLLPTGGAVGGVAYVLDFSNGPYVMAVDANGAVQQSYIQNPTYGLALWRGGENTPPRLAWGTQIDAQTRTSTLQASNLDGSQLETLYTLDASSVPMHLVAQLWSADGRSLYFSREPDGIGGYILFAGASSLYRIDVTSKAVTEVVPFNAAGGGALCLDALSGDYRLLADHCAQNSISVRDLAAGTAVTIQPPQGMPEFSAMGSARFSPSGDRVAFAMAKGNPDSEQGWVAVSDGLSGTSHLVLSGEPGSYYTVAGWLDDQTLLVEYHPMQCEGECASQLWTVGADGSNPQMVVADGAFLTVVDNR